MSSSLSIASLKKDLARTGSKAMAYLVLLFVIALALFGAYLSYVHLFRVDALSPEEVPLTLRDTTIRDAVSRQTKPPVSVIPDDLPTPLDDTPGSADREASSGVGPRPQ